MTSDCLNIALPAVVLLPPVSWEALLLGGQATIATMPAIVAWTTLIALMAIGGLGASAGGAAILKRAVSMTICGVLAIAVTAVVLLIFGVAAW